VIARVIGGRDVISTSQLSWTTVCRGGVHVETRLRADTEVLPRSSGRRQGFWWWLGAEQNRFIGECLT
jgi:hypothetical protein